MYRYAVPQDNFGQLEKLASQQNQIALQKAMQPSTGQRLIGAAEGIGHSLLDYDRGRKKREAEERKDLAMRAMSRNDYEFDINQLNNWVTTGQGPNGSADIPVRKVVKEEKPQKPLAPHYGPVYGRGGKYYQSIFQAGKEGSPALQEVELGGEPMQVTAQKQAAMARYADDVRAEASTTYDAIKTKAGLAYAAQGENVARALAAYNAVMTTEIGKLKKHQISQAVKDIWRADETPAQGSGGQPTGSGDAFPVRPVYQWTDKELLEGKQDH